MADEPRLTPELQDLVTRAIAAGVAHAAAEMAKRPAAPPTDARTMAELWEEYLPTLVNSNSAANARTARKKGDIPFRHQGQTWVLSQLTYAQLSRKLLAAWIAHLRTVKNARGGISKAAAVDQTRKCWQAMLGHFVLAEDFPKNPFSRLPFEAQEGEGQRQGYLSADEVERLCRYARPMLGAMARVAHRAGGLRNAELRTLKKAQIDWSKKEAWVVRKRGRVTTFIVPDDALEILRAWSEISPSEFVFPNPRDPRGRPLPPKTFNSWFRKAADDAKLVLTGDEPAVPHHLRHGFIVESLQKGAPDIHVAEQAGHKTTAELARYGKARGAAKETLRKIVNMTVAEAKQTRPTEFRCPDCDRPYADIRMAAACFDKHQRTKAHR